jgi:hypothetical protein
VFNFPREKSKEVVGLDITVDEGFGVDILDTGDKLVGQERVLPAVVRPETSLHPPPRTADTTVKQ